MRAINGAFVAWGVLLTSATVCGQTVYVASYAGSGTTQRDRLRRGDILTGATEVVLTTNHVEPEALAIDPSEGKLYFVDRYGRGRIATVGTDGSSLQDVVPDVFIFALTLDPIDRKLYWPHGRYIYRANLDGSDIEEVYDQDHGSVQTLAIDPVARKLWWSDRDVDRIRRSELNGSDVQDVFAFTSNSFISGLAVDAAGGKVYWLDSQLNRIQRGNMDGFGVETLVTGIDLAVGLALDLSRGKLYFGGYGHIYRANLDGTAVEDILPSGGWAIVVDETAQKLYWSAGTSIFRADLDGLNVEGVLVTEELGPHSIAVDLDDNRLYWADYTAYKIRRSGLDGSNIEDLVYTYPRRPRGIALDLSEGKVYWTVTLYPDAKVQRANLDGSELEDLFVSQERVPRAIALDLVNRKMYWTSNPHIFRANLDGSLAEYLTVGWNLYGVAVDPIGGYFYWSIEWTPHEPPYYTAFLRRMPLEGGMVEDLFTSTEVTLGELAIDQEAGKIYWTTGRANLDGSELEFFPPGLYGRPGIAVDPRVSIAELRRVRPRLFLSSSVKSHFQVGSFWKYCFRECHNVALARRREAAGSPIVDCRLKTSFPFLRRGACPPKAGPFVPPSLPLPTFSAR